MDDVISGKIILDIEMAKKFIEECAQQITHPLKHDSQTAVSQYNRKICGKKKTTIADLPRVRLPIYLWYKNC